MANIYQNVRNSLYQIWCTFKLLPFSCF